LSHLFYFFLEQVYQPSEEEMDPYENTICIECNQSGEDNLMLQCDVCESSAHTFCVGLGREVPEESWSCGECRFTVEGPSYAQTQDQVVNHGESNMNTADTSSSSFGRSVLNGVSQRPPPPLNIHQPSLQGFDLNLSPIETPDEDKRAESHVLAEPVSTPTGRHATLDRRRALNRRIRILLFRPRTATAWQNGLQHDRTTPGTEQNQQSTCTSTEDSPSCSRADLLQSQQSSSHFVQSASNLTQCTYEGGNNFREVENAKEQLIPIVKKSIKHICAQSPLGMYKLFEQTIV
jgi:ribosomal protein L37AE/L43A